MVAIWIERRSKAAALSRSAGLFALTLTVVGAVAHRTGHLSTETFLTSLIVVGAFVLLAALLWLRGFTRMWREGDRVGSDLLVAALCIALLAGPIAWMGMRALTTPPLADITTDRAVPPALLLTGKASAWRNPLAPIGAGQAAAQQEAYPDLVTHRYVLDAARVRQLVGDLATARGWTITRPFAQGPAAESATLNAVAGSFLLNFPSDIAIRVADDGDTSLVDMRSASQFGSRDFGDNAMRIRRFFKDLDAAVAAVTTAGVTTDDPGTILDLPELGPTLD